MMLKYNFYEIHINFSKESVQPVDSSEERGPSFVVKNENDTGAG